jgi:hypothetical protein
MDSNLLRSFAANVDWIYAGLTRLAGSDPTLYREKGLGGKLLYADQLEGAGSVLVVAANIAGVASLSATENIATQRQAIRARVVDILVSSVGEALPILRQEIRQSNPVAVCVTQSPGQVECEMEELGVWPDLLPPGALNADRLESFLDHGAQKINPVAASENQTVLTWTVDRVPALWLPKLDAIALDCLDSYQGAQGSADPYAWAQRRWLTHAPGYLGRLARGSRLWRCPTPVARMFLTRVQEQMEARLIEAAVEIGLSSCGEVENHQLSKPPDRHRSKVSVLVPADGFNPGP